MSTNQRILVNEQNGHCWGHGDKDLKVSRVETVISDKVTHELIKVEIKFAPKPGLRIESVSMNADGTATISFKPAEE